MKTGAGKFLCYNLIGSGQKYLLSEKHRITEKSNDSENDKNNKYVDCLCVA